MGRQNRPGQDQFLFTPAPRLTTDGMPWLYQLVPSIAGFLLRGPILLLSKFAVTLPPASSPDGGIGRARFNGRHRPPPRLSRQVPESGRMAYPNSRRDTPPSMFQKNQDD